ncbi:hypothetical protein DIPPA_22567 [Diplonema papillatum]|nr:hypothetical protein DIPPA_22567 [Diplonema papillatum]
MRDLGIQGADALLPHLKYGSEFLDQLERDVLATSAGLRDVDPPVRDAAGSGYLGRHLLHHLRTGCPVSELVGTSPTRLARPVSPRSPKKTCCTANPTSWQGRGRSSVPTGSDLGVGTTTSPRATRA